MKRPCLLQASNQFIKNASCINLIHVRTPGFSHPSPLALNFHLHLYTSLHHVPSTKHEGTGCFYCIISQLDSHTLWPKPQSDRWFTLSWFWLPKKIGDRWHPSMSSPKEPWTMVISWFSCHCYCHCIKSPWQSLQWLLSRCPPPPLGVSWGQRATRFRCNRDILAECI